VAPVWVPPSLLPIDPDGTLTPFVLPVLYLCPLASPAHCTLKIRQHGLSKHWCPSKSHIITTQDHNLNHDLYSTIGRVAELIKMYNRCIVPLYSHFFLQYLTNVEYVISRLICYTEIHTDGPQ